MSAPSYQRPFEPLLGADTFVKGPLLVVAPHPDDETIGVGGLIAHHRARGQPVTVVVMTDGGLGDLRRAHGDDYARMRERETRTALERLGGADVVFLGHPDGGLATSSGAVADLARVVAERKPATVAFPSPFEVHPDHRAAGLIALEVLASAQPTPIALAFEIGAMMPANALLDITPVLSIKEHALGAFESQLMHQDIVGKVRSLNRARTVNIDDARVTAVEAYCFVRMSGIGAYRDAAEALCRIVDGMGPLAGAPES